MKKLTRQSNYELLRILCMLMVMCGHLCGHRYASVTSVSGDDLVMLHFVRSFTKAAVDTFILLSGFFGVKFKLDRLLHLLFQIFCFSVLMFSVSVLLGWHEVSIVKDFLVFFPVFSNQYWFITAYIILYLIAPFLNKGCENLSRQSYLFLLGIGFVLFYLWPSFTSLVNASYIIGDSGYGIVNFVYLYFLGRYIKLHGSLTHSFKFYFGLYLTSCLLLFLAHYSLSSLFGFTFTAYYAHNTIFILIGAILLFCSFSKLKFQSSFINNLAKSCLAVYLIHYAPRFWHNFCNHVLSLNETNGVMLLCLVLFVPIGIYVICHFMEKTRHLLFNSLENKIIDSLVQTKVARYISQKYSEIS